MSMLQVLSYKHVKTPLLLLIAKKKRNEMKSLSNLDHDSILETLKHFSWETVYLELEINVPTLIELLR